jgi:DNA-binding CsgD family transcriptional regulator
MMTQPCTCAPELGADELRYLQLLSNGHPVSDIARMTGARESDIEALLESAQTKLGARNRLQALLAATRLGLFPLA